MGDDCNSGVVQVEPGGNLSICDNEDVPHPGGMSLHRPQRITELLIVLKSTGGDVFVLLGLEGDGVRNITLKHYYLNNGRMGHLRDGCDVPEQVGGAYRQLVSIQRQVLLGLLGQIGEILRGLQVEQSDAGFRVQLQLLEENFFHTFIHNKHRRRLHFLAQTHSGKMKTEVTTLVEAAILPPGQHDDITLK